MSGELSQAAPPRHPLSAVGRRGLVGVGLALAALLVGLGGLVSVNAMASHTVQEEETYGFRGTSVSIDLTVGDVEVVPSDKDDEISVRRRLTYGLRRPFVDARIDGATFKVRDGDCVMPVLADCHVRWLLEVPRDVGLEVTTKTGDITVSGMAGQVRLTSASGAVTAKALSGQTAQLLSDEGKVTGTDIRSTHVVATSISGDISVMFRTPPKLVRGLSTTGSVAVILPDGDEAYRITAVAGDGKTITANSDPNATRSINVRSDESAVTVLQSPAS
jgi:hypothetical protein